MQVRCPPVYLKRKSDSRIIDARSRKEQPVAVAASSYKVTCSTLEGISLDIERLIALSLVQDEAFSVSDIAA